MSRNRITTYAAGKMEPNASDLMRLSGALAVPSTTYSAAGASRLHPVSPYVPTPHCGKTRRSQSPQENSAGLRRDRRDHPLPTARQASDVRRGPWVRSRIVKSRALRTRCVKRAACTTRDRRTSQRSEGLGVRTLFFEHDGNGLEGLSTIQGEMILVCWGIEAGDRVERS